MAGLGDLPPPAEPCWCLLMQYNRIQKYRTRDVLDFDPKSGAPVFDTISPAAEALAGCAQTLWEKARHKPPRRRRPSITAIPPHRPAHVTISGGALDQGTALCTSILKQFDVPSARGTPGSPLRASKVLYPGVLGTSTSPGLGATLGGTLASAGFSPAASYTMQTSTSKLATRAMASLAKHQGRYLSPGPRIPTRRAPPPCKSVAVRYYQGAGGLPQRMS